VGGLGVCFRAAGLGYLGQSLSALTLGVVMLTVGLRIAADNRRATFAGLRSHRTASFAVASFTAAPTVLLHPARTDGPFSTGNAPTRVRVHAWVGPMLELPAAS